MPLPPGIYNGRGKAQLTGDLPMGRGFDWTKAAAKIDVSREHLASRSMFQTLQQFQWLPQHSRISPIRQYPPSSFSRTPASFLADRPGLKLPTTKLQVIKLKTKPSNSNCDSSETLSSSRPFLSAVRNCNQNYAHVLSPAGVRKSLAIEGGHVAPLRSANGHQGIWN